MNKLTNYGKKESRFNLGTGLKAFCYALLLGIPFLSSGPSVRGDDDRHILIEQTDIEARRPGYAAGPRNEHPQPVLFKLPEKAVIEIAGPNGFEANQTDPGLFGLIQGEVYRLKITQIPYAEGKELYPTLELLSTLSPPPGAEADFPIPVELSQEDLENALAGNLVTRVVYLEPPHNAIPIDSTVPHGTMMVDAPASTNPVAFAESRGRVMAILRVGSRIPENVFDPASSFFRGLPPRTFPHKRDRSNETQPLDSSNF